MDHCSQACGRQQRTGDLPRPPEPEIYLSLWQTGAFSKDLVIRTAADPRAVIADVQRELRGVDPTVAVENVKTLDQVRADSVATRTCAMQLLVGFSIVASILTLVGVYGMLTLSVASRRREIAVRPPRWRRAAVRCRGVLDADHRSTDRSARGAAQHVAPSLSIRQVSPEDGNRNKIRSNEAAA